jgi:hypothetical protein
MYSGEFSYDDVEGSLQDVVSSALMHGESSKFIGFDSDPYGELDDTTRGVTMAMSTDSFWFAESSKNQSGSFLGKDPLFCSREGFEYSLPGTCSETSSFFLPFQSGNSLVPGSAILIAHSEHFQEHHVPPNPPSSQLFAFTPTTLFLEGCGPQQIGKSVVDFLTSQVVASVTKVKPEKYSITAEVFVEAVSCTIKVRVYKHEGRYAVEVQRRSGDAFVLESTYRLLVEFLETRCGGVSGTHASAPLTQPALPEPESTEEDTEVPSVEVLAPVLAMATVAGLQAEAASTLAAIIHGGHVSAAALFSDPDQVAFTLMDLLASGCVDTVYPVARCVSGLAAFGEADSILAHHGLLQKMALQAVAELRTAQGLVGTALAQAVIDAVQCCAGALTAAAVKELQQVLHDAMNDEVLKANAVARAHLERAWLSTNLIVA